MVNNANYSSDVDNPIHLGLFSLAFAAFAANRKDKSI